MTQDEALRVLQSLPDDVRERALASLKEQGERLKVLKALVDEGLSDAGAGHVSDWSLSEFLAEMDEEERSELRVTGR